MKNQDIFYFGFGHSSKIQKEFVENSVRLCWKHVCELLVHTHAASVDFGGDDDENRDTSAWLSGFSLSGRTNAQI